MEDDAFFQHAVAALTSTTNQPHVKAELVKEIKSKLENLSASEVAPRLEQILGPFINILKTVDPAFVSDDKRHILRHAILDTLFIVPANDAFKQNATELMKTLLDVLRLDNEENAYTSCKIMMELHKNYKSQLEDTVESFFGLVMDMYKNVKQAVHDTFDVTGDHLGTNYNYPAQADEAIPAQEGRPLAKSLYSFRVLKECPIFMVLLLQIHRKYQNAVQSFIPIIIGTVLPLSPQAQVKEHEAAAAKGQIFVGVSPHIKNRHAYAEFKAMQVKTLSFIAYILRQLVQVLQPHQQAIADSVIQLMKDCPPEGSSMRKELLVATRHLWASEFRSAFVRHIDILLDENVVVGTGVSSRETLRPLAHSFLADLLHHVRSGLTQSQLTSIVNSYAQHLHDSSFGPQIQTMCSKLLLNLVESIVTTPDKVWARSLLLKILDTFATKFHAMHTAIPLITKHNSKKRGSLRKTDVTLPDFKPEESMYLELEHLQPIQVYAGPYDSSQDVIREIRFLFRNLVFGVKTVLGQLRSSNPTPTGDIPADWSSLVRGFGEVETNIIIRILRDGLKCFSLYTVDNDKNGNNPTNAKDEKDVLEAFATIFTLLEPSVFLEVFTSEIDLVVDQTVKDTVLLGISHFFLINVQVSPKYAGVLLRYLVDKLENLGGSDMQSQVLLRLFKLIFLGVTVFPDQNEVVLQPHLGNLIRSCLRMAKTSKDPHNYFVLLRSMFRSIGGGKFEQLYKEVLPILPELLETLNNLLANAHKQSMKELYVELCLTVPVRLSVLLPYLSHLMKPLVLALQAGPELVSQGLRTLELCIDNLTHEFLDPILTPVIHELMAALWKHLRPLPHNSTHSHTTMRILGKLGGRNRRILKDPPHLNDERDLYHGLDLGIVFEPEKLATLEKPDQLLQLDPILNLAQRILTSVTFHKDPQVTNHYREQAFEFVKASLPLLIDFNSTKKDLAHQVAGHIEYFADKYQEATEKSDSKTSVEGANPHVPKAQREAHENAMTKALVCLFSAAARVKDQDPIPMQQEAKELIQIVTNHFVLLHFIETMNQNTNVIPLWGAGISTLEVSYNSIYNSQISCYVDAVAEAMTSENPPVRTIGEETLLEFQKAMLNLVKGKTEMLEHFPVFLMFAHRLTAWCYRQESFRKAGACAGIRFMCRKLSLGSKWLMERELEFVKAMLHVLKDTASDTTIVNNEEAVKTLGYLVKAACRPSGEVGEDEDGFDTNGDVVMTDAEPEDSPRKRVLSMLISQCGLELSHANATIRKTAQDVLALIAKETNQTVADLLQDSKDKILTPIFTKPLRALPTATQIGYIDAVRYCLTLKPPFVALNEDFMRHMQEAFAFADAEDQALAPNRTIDYKLENQLMQLRVVCLDQLTAAVMTEEMQTDPKHSSMRSRVIAVFFKSLHSKYPEVIKVAHDGLKEAIGHHSKLPKELLQQGLRPILVNLSDYKKLTVAGLEGLSRLLQLLTSYFKVEIGRKLLDHLKSWILAIKFEEAATKPLSELEDVRLMVAILDVFHLLPSAANVFLEELIAHVVFLETHLHRSVSSPFRLPLVKYLNRYPQNALDFFYKNLSTPAYARLFIDMLRRPEAVQLRQEAMKEMGRLDAIFKENPGTTVIVNRLLQTVSIDQDASSAEDQIVLDENTVENLNFYGICIVRELAQYDPDWLLREPLRLESVLSIWRDVRRRETSEQDPQLIRTQQNRYILEIMISFLKSQLQADAKLNIPLLFELVEAFNHHTALDYSFLKKFLWVDVAMKYPAKLREEILRRFLTLFPLRDQDSQGKIQALRYLVTPLLLCSLTMEQFAGTIDAQMVRECDERIWKPFAGQTPTFQWSVIEDALKIEYMQFSTLLVLFATSLVEPYSKTLGNAEWRITSVEDPLTKNAAHTATSFIAEKYEQAMPPRALETLFVTRLKNHHSECRQLVKQALDILIPIMPNRVLPGEKPPGDPGYSPKWIKWCAATLRTDPSNNAQLTSVYQVLVRHSHLFYPYRVQFIQGIVQSLAKLGLASVASNETRALTVDLVELLCNWEKKRLEEALEPKGNKRKRSASPEPVESAEPKPDRGTSIPPTTFSHAMLEAAAKDPGPMTTQQKETTVNYALRFITTLNEPLVKKGMSLRLAILLRDLLLLWPDVGFNLATVEKVLSQDLSDNTLPVACNLLELLHAMTETKSPEWFSQNISALHRCMDKVLRNENNKVIKSLHPMLKLMYTKFNKIDTMEDPNKQEIAAFAKSVDSVIQAGLSTQTNAMSVVSLLHAAYDKPLPSDPLDTFIPMLAKLLSKLVKEHFAPPPQPVANEKPPPPPESNAPVLISLLELLKLRTPQMSHENRRILLMSLVHLIEKSPDSDLLHCILKIVKEWVHNKAEVFPTLKEKASLLARMIAFEGRNDRKLVEEYLNLVADIYSDLSFARTDLTIKLEQAFLFGTRAENPTLRNRFLSIFDKSIGKNLLNRLNYVLGTQNWEGLGSHFWIQQALDLALGSVSNDAHLVQAHASDRVISLEKLQSIEYSLPQKDDVDMTDGESPLTFVERHLTSLEKFKSLTTASIIKGIRQLIFADHRVAHQMWIILFPLMWNRLNNLQRGDLVKNMVPGMLARDYHIRQVNARPNVIQCLFEGFARCVPPVPLPSQLVKYLGKTFDAWHSAIHILNGGAVSDASTWGMAAPKEDERLRDNAMDALADMYTELSEDDYFAGSWRRRCVLSETNAALSYEQVGLWHPAQNMYEMAQSKAKNGVLPFNESEYILWTDHWTLCTEKLQAWDILADYARQEGQSDLLLEAAWRITDWTSAKEGLQAVLNPLLDNPTPRRKMFEAFLILKSLPPEAGPDHPDFAQACDAGIQLALKRWFSLPDIVSNAHIPVLHQFQEFVELHEAAQIHRNLSATNAGNIDQKSGELKGTLQTWRERLPNLWEDINLWSDLVSWRQHVFDGINKAYLPLLPILSQTGGAGGAANPSSSHGYRGYHETAWIINRFAHVARKHGLTDVCMHSLSKIYTLPNIEIQEAFYKLREQVKCHFQYVGDYASGLDVINSTNLMYFSTSQKAEFFTLKADFLSKMNLHDEANHSYGAAVQIDLNWANAWASWGHYNDRMLKENPTQTDYGMHAINCYLHAAGLLKNARSRKYNARVLWILSLDDGNGTMYQSFEKYKGEFPPWYWITFIPQLLTSLFNKESRHARILLKRIARTFPQALQYHLRTARDEIGALKKQHIAQSTELAKQKAEAQAAVKSLNPMDEEGDPSAEAADGDSQEMIAAKQKLKQVLDQEVALQAKKAPWEALDEVFSSLKSQAPLLALTMESTAEQIISRLKPTADDDMYRLIVALHNDACGHLVSRIISGEGFDTLTHMKSNLQRLAEGMNHQSHVKYKQPFEKDFIDSNPNLFELVARFRDWRDKLELLLDSRPRKNELEQSSGYLTEFEHQRFADIDMFGQYLLIRDPAPASSTAADFTKDFIKIDKFMPELESVRIYGQCLRRFTVRGHDGSLHPFVVQNPATRQGRREERIMQLFRLYNVDLDRSVETRKRNLQFHLPLIIPFSASVRLVQDDPSYVSLYDVFEDHCHRTGLYKDQPIIYYSNTLKDWAQTLDQDKESAPPRKIPSADTVSLRQEIVDQIQSTMVPDTMLNTFMLRKMATFADFWTLRKQFTHQMATTTFMTYVMGIGPRYAHRMLISTKTGNIWTTELVPMIHQSKMLFVSTDKVPFRFTPNIQTFITPAGVEGPFASSLMAVGRALTDNQYDMDDYLSLFVRDDIVSWYSGGQMKQLKDDQLREAVLQNVDLILKRAQALACKTERERAVGAIQDNNIVSAIQNGQNLNPLAMMPIIPVNQTIVDLVSQATNPQNLAQMDTIYQAWI